MYNRTEDKNNDGLDKAVDANTSNHGPILKLTLF